jgi:SNF2 family DNA or RNA helicase
MPKSKAFTPKVQKQAKIMTKAEKINIKGGNGTVDSVEALEMTMGVEPSTGLRFSLPSAKKRFYGSAGSSDEGTMIAIGSPTYNNSVPAPSSTGTTTSSGPALFSRFSLPSTSSSTASAPPTKENHREDIIEDDSDVEVQQQHPNDKSFEFEDDTLELISKHKQSLALRKATIIEKQQTTSGEDQTTPEHEDLVLSPDGKLPVVRVPAPVNAKLFEYQRDGIRFFYNLYVNDRGGILADDMGLGKTIQTICFVMAIKAAQPSQSSFFAPSNSNSMLDDIPIDVQRKLFTPIATLPILIVTPASLLQHWHREFYEWTKLRTFIAHGKKDKISVLESAKANKLDVVLLSYDTLVSSTKQLNGLNFSCVIFDEAHKVKNRNSKLFSSCWKLRIKRKYGLTGTVMQNSFEELWTLCHVLGFATNTLGDLDYFKKHYIQPIREGHVQDASNAQISRASIVSQSLVEKLSRHILRRTKQCIAHQLPPKEDHIVFCQPTELQLRIYKRITDSQLYRLLRANSVPCSCGSGHPAIRCCSRKQRSLFEGIDMPKVALPALTRLQQLANHVSLIVPPELIDELISISSLKKRNKSFGSTSSTSTTSNSTTNSAANGVPLITNFFEPAAPSSTSETPKKPSKKTVNTLRPSFPTIESTSPKASESAEGDKPLSSLVNSAFLKMAFGQDMDEIVDLIANGDDDMQLCGKLKVLSSLLPHWKSQNAKVLLFSSSTRLMDILAKFCTKQGFSFGRVEGTTPIHQRQRLVDSFNRTKSQFIFIVSTKACGVGLNLSSANVVVIFEPHFNVSLDMQASDRAHRIGQVRTTRVYRLVSAFTIEELTYRRQIYKQQMANIATEGKSERRFFKMSEVFGAHLLFSLLDRSQLNTVDIIERANNSSSTSTSGEYDPREDRELTGQSNFRVTRDSTTEATGPADGKNALLQLIVNRAQPQEDDFNLEDGLTERFRDSSVDEKTSSNADGGGALATEDTGFSLLDQSESANMDELLKKAGVLHSHLNSDLFSGEPDPAPKSFPPSTAPRLTVGIDATSLAISPTRPSGIMSNPNAEIDFSSPAFVGDGDRRTESASADEFPELM